MTYTGRSELVGRRALMIGGGAAMALAAGSVPLRAQGTARWRRYNVASAQGQQMLASYQVAIAAMLKLPPTDPRNWYRVAFTHFLDCPHGNWWLYPWHRGFTGQVERIVRQLSGNPAFAFPYWDWTANPAVPAVMSQGLLNPANPAFIGDVNAFAAAFKPALAASGYFTPGSAQLAQLTYRDLTSNDMLWDQLTDPQNPNYPSFFPAQGTPAVRNPAASLDCVASKAVSGQTVAAGMAARAYTVAPTQPISANFFSSPKAAHHSDMVGFAVLEGQPHNMVHNNVGGIVHPTVGGQCSTSSTNGGGFMQAFLSPVDPLFFLHHSNLDRLWTAWTQRQMLAGLPYLPTGSDLPLWSNEPFLFFCDAAGRPVEAKAGDYATIGSFAYDYQPGRVGAARQLTRGMAGRRPVRFVAAASRGTAMAGGGAGRADTVVVVPDLVALAAAENADSAVVSVTLMLPHAPRGQAFPVLVDTGNAGEAVEVGRVALFGHSMAHGPLTFALPFGATLGALRQRGALKSGGTLRFTATAPGGGAMAGMTATAAAPVPVQAVVIDGMR